MENNAQTQMTEYMKHGYECYMRGIGISENLYCYGTQANAEWKKGWEIAQAEHPREDE